MIKIGDKVQFNKYLPKNIVTNKIIRRSLVDKRYVTARDKETIRTVKDGVIRFKSVIVTEVEKMEGVFLGTYRKKLVRKYHPLPPPEPVTLVRPTFVGTRERLRNMEQMIEDVRAGQGIIDQIMEAEIGLPFNVPREPIVARPINWGVTHRHGIIEPVSKINRYSTNPRRIDDPRELDKIALISYKKKIIGVPMVNILLCTGNSYLVI